MPKIQIFDWFLQDSTTYKQTTYQDVTCGSIFPAKACMYDRVTGTFFENKGTGDFVYGLDDDGTPYLESTGTQYIDTEYYPNNKTRAECEFSTLDNLNGNIFGSNSDSGLSPNIEFFCNLGGRIHFGQSADYASNYSINTKYNLSLSQQGFYVNNELKFSPTPQSFDMKDSETKGYTLSLYREHGANLGFPSTIKVYSFKVYDGTNLIYDLVPVNPIPSNIYFENTAHANSNSIGNTFASKLAFVSSDSSSVDMSLSDGKYRVDLKILKDSIEFEGQTFNLDTSVFNDYLISMKDDVCRLYVNKNLLYQGTPTTSSIDIYAKVGYQNYTSGSSITYLKYLKITKGARRPLNLDNFQFELQIDTTDQFNSINLRTFKNTGNVVNCVEDPSLVGTALGDGLVRAFTVPLLPRQDNQIIYYFYRVKVSSPEYTSAWGYFYFDEPINPFLFTTKDIMTKVEKSNIFNGLVAFCMENRYSYMYLEDGTGEVIDNDTVLPVEQDSNAVWKKVSHSYFYLDPNITSSIFESIYDNRLPGQNVYSRYNKSGNIANILESESAVIEMVDFEIKNTVRDLNIQSCRDKYLYNNFGKGLGIAAEYFNNPNEYRDALLAINNVYCTPGVYNPLIYLFEVITGVKPDIVEYKDKKTWVLWSEEDALTKPDSERFIINDDNFPYSNRPSIVLYSEAGKAFSFDIHIYNPYGLKLNYDMVKTIVETYKPVASQANIIFHTPDGREVQYPGYYYFSNMGEGLYYRSDFSQ